MQARSSTLQEGSQDWLVESGETKKLAIRKFCIKFHPCEVLRKCLQAAWESRGVQPNCSGLNGMGVARFLRYDQKVGARLLACDLWPVARPDRALRTSLAPLPSSSSQGWGPWTMLRSSKRHPMVSGPKGQRLNQPPCKIAVHF